MLIRPRTQLDFLHLGGLLVTPALMIFFAQLIFILPKVHNPTDGRNGIGSDFHQIIAAFLSLTKSIRRRKDAELLSLRTNDTNFSDTNLTVHA